ncbi:MAG: hypothetical protein C3F10_15875 [Dehalococcoidia bacterium]|nr:MAG: hypothetical protein C3F10_15875 [Dehalococcoidia bacterium]
MRLTPFVPLVLALFAFSACGNNGPEPDRVVNIEQQCSAWYDGAFREVPSEVCAKKFLGEPPDPSGYFKAALTLTVRTPQGTTYTIEVPPDTSIELGDPWPPEESR